MLQWCMEHPWMAFILLFILVNAFDTFCSWNRKRQVLEKDARIHELEEILCPCEQHDWLLVRTFEDKDGIQRQRSLCSRCKKEKVV